MEIIGVFPLGWLCLHIVVKILHYRAIRRVDERVGLGHSPLSAPSLKVKVKLKSLCAISVINTFSKNCIFSDLWMLQ